jgi:hypothetical protein
MVSFILLKAKDDFDQDINGKKVCIFLKVKKTELICEKANQ